MQQRVELGIASGEKIDRVRGEEDSRRHAHKGDQVNQEEQQQGSEDDRQTDGRNVPSHPRGAAGEHGHHSGTTMNSAGMIARMPNRIAAAMASTSLSSR